MGNEENIKNDQEEDLKEDDDDIELDRDIDNKKRFEAAENFLHLVDSIKESDKNVNNYSEDDNDDKNSSSKSEN